MRRYFWSMILSVFVLSLSSFSFAFGKEQRCSIGEVSTLEHRNGVTVRVVSFVEEAQELLGPEITSKTPVPNRKRVYAHVYIPDTADAVPVPAILFSHSGIHTNRGTTSMLPFAFAMARAGAASIVLDRTAWNTPEEAANRDPSVIHCASTWLQSEVRVDPKRIAGQGDFFPYEEHLVGLNLDSEINANSGFVKDARAQVFHANWYCRLFKLPNINPEWLKVETTPDDGQVTSSAK